jgi:gamma-glutamylcyclotransferase (GGCT)/AIG2-like uncharacterized protein YtfP
MSALVHRIFVYGTLMSGEPNYRLLTSSVLVGQVLTARGYTLYDLGPFPALVCEGRGRVAGELFEVDDATLALLDRLEGVPTFYTRATLTLEDRTLAEAYVLSKGKVRGKLAIASGSWREHRKDREQCRS